MYILLLYTNEWTRRKISPLRRTKTCFFLQDACFSCLFTYINVHKFSKYNYLKQRYFLLQICIFNVQVNLFQKPSFLHQLTHNMTRDCSLNSKKNTSLQHVVYKYCFECQNENKKKQFLYSTCCQLVFFVEFNEQSLVILWVN
jgi:hypothetical protein